MAGVISYDSQKEQFQIEKDHLLGAEWGVVSELYLFDGRNVQGCGENVFCSVDQTGNESSFFDGQGTVFSAKKIHGRRSRSKRDSYQIGRGIAYGFYGMKFIGFVKNNITCVQLKLFFVSLNKNGSFVYI